MDVGDIGEAPFLSSECHKSMQVTHQGFLHFKLVYKEDSPYKEIFNNFVSTKTSSRNIFSYSHPSNILSLNPQTLAKTAMKIGGLVTIQIAVDYLQTNRDPQQIFTANTKHIYRIHVDSTLALDTVATSDTTLDAYDGAFCLLEAFQSNYEQASLCKIEIQGDTADASEEYKEFLKQIIRNQKRNAVVFCGQVFALCRGIYAKVVKVNNKEIDTTLDSSYYQLSLQTKIFISCEKENMLEESKEEEAWDIFLNGGCLADVCSVIASMMDMTKGNFRSCLLHAPPDSGERHVVWKVAKEHGVEVVEVPFLDVYSLDLEEFGRKLEKLSQRLITNHQHPTILFLPLLEAFYPSTSNIPYLLNHHLTSMLQKHGSLLIMASSAHASHRHLTCKNSGVFSLVVNIPPPDMPAKLQILSKLLKLDDLEILRSKIKSYSISDLHHIALKTRMMCMLYASEVSAGHLMQVIDGTPPSLVRSVVIEHPGVEYSHVGGREALKTLLQQFIDLSIHKSQLFSQTNLSPPKGVLLFGPPGCSKTMLAKAIASECSLNFIAVQGASLHGMYVGETEAAIRDVFNKARMAPSVLFFDEVDAFASCRGSDNTAGLQDRVMQQLLTEVDGCSRLNQVFIMAATNRPDLIDKAFMRPGRFDRCIYVPLPDHTTRQAILHKRLSEAGINEGDIEALVCMTESFSCAEVSNIIDEAWLLALENNEVSIKLEHVLKVIEGTRPSVSQQMVQWYEEYDRLFSH